MGANRYRSVAVGVIGALALTGCASVPMPVTNSSSPAAVDCKAFESHLAGLAARIDNDEPQTSAVADGGDDDEGQARPGLPLFSTAKPGVDLPEGWLAWTVNRNKKPTRYTLTEIDRRLVVHAKAESSASGLYVPLSNRVPGVLRWTWKTRDVIRNADNASAPTEDAPLRLFVAFDGDKSTLPLKDQLMYEMARLTTGREMPYATLMYIWGGKRPEETVLANPHTDRVRMIVVDSGTRHANQWRCYERDLRADYRKAFGAEPGSLVAVGIMTDTDNTKSQAEAWYGDISLD